MIWRAKKSLDFIALILYCSCTMNNYYDDNFGFYDMSEGSEAVEFYRSNQRRSVWKVCSICEQKVKLLPHYDKCNSCADAIENGWQY